MKLLTAQNQETIKVAGLSAFATALVSFAINKLIEIELNFWYLLILLVLGISVFVYIDVRGGKPDGDA
jgi:hypothetical protein